MQFGIGLATAADSWKVVQRAEALGFSHAWFEDSQMIAADPFVAMAASAMQTTTIRLGTGVCVPSNRIPPVTANMLASLNALAPGRIDWGVGTGFSARRAMGLPAMRVSELRDYVDAVKALLAGRATQWDFAGERRTIRFLNPERGLFNVDDPIAVHIAANGPRSRALTAASASHWMAVYAGPEQAQSDLAAMSAAYAAAGCDADDFSKTAYTFGGVIRDGETCATERVRQQAGPLAAMSLHNVMERQYGDLGTGGIEDEALLGAYQALYDRYEPADERYLSLHRGHALFLREDEASLITADFIRRMSFTGSVDELADAIKHLRDAGYTGVSFVVLPHLPEAVDDWARVMERVAA